MSEYTSDPTEEALADELVPAISEVIATHERAHGYLVNDLRAQAVYNAVHAVLDTIYGVRCPGCGDRGPSSYHGPGVCV